MTGFYFYKPMNNQLYQIQNWPERAQAAKWCATTLAQNCGVSLRTLQRHFLKEMGKSPKKWLLEQRNQKADEMLKGGLRIKEAAGSLDYKHSTHLSRDYKEYLECCLTDKTAPIRRAQNP
jgi:AraC-like DNA-binding protein